MFIRLAKIFLLLPLLLLNSCIEGEEEIWINLDASGKIRAHYEFPPALKAQIGDPDVIVATLRAVDEGEDGIEIQALSFEMVGRQLIFHLEATFDDATDLLAVSERNMETIVEETGMDPEQADAISGKITFAMNGMSPSFQREISLAGMFPGMVARNPKLLGESNFRYLIHLPFPVTETNAHQVLNDGKTLSWTFLLRDHVSEPMALSLQTKILIPWWVWGLLLVGLVLLVLLVRQIFWRSN
ncbi:MAG: hypothetical protein ABF377_08285 [Akkermansiaceae bacterium]